MALAKIYSAPKWVKTVGQFRSWVADTYSLPTASIWVLKPEAEGNAQDINDCYADSVSLDKVRKAYAKYQPSTTKTARGLDL